MNVCECKYACPSQMVSLSAVVLRRRRYFRKAGDNI